MAGETGGEQVTVTVVCVLHRRRVRADGLTLRHDHDGPCDSRRFIIRTDRYVDREQGLAAALELAG